MGEFNTAEVVRNETRHADYSDIIIDIANVLKSEDANIRNELESVLKKYQDEKKKIATS